MIDTKELQKEIALKEDECCIVFDFGCYFPYSNQEILTFDFSLGMEELEDKKLNHRYPNRGYQTISRKYGRKVSKVGYPYVMKINEQHPMLLHLKVGLKGQYISLVFPVETKMTKENPICVLSLHYMFDDNKFSFSSCERIQKGYWNIHNWHSHNIENPSEFDVVLEDVHRVENSLTLIYQDVIIPFPLPIEF